MQVVDSQADVRQAIEAFVREAVRSRRIDPMRDPQAVHDLANEALARLFPSGLAIDGDAVAETLADVHHAVSGFGPLQRFFDDPLVEEVWINDPGHVFVARAGRSELTSCILAHNEVQDLVERMLRWSGRRLDLSNPFVDAMLPDGSRLHVVIPDVTREHWSVNVRRFVLRAATLNDLVDRGTLSSTAARFLEACVVSGLNIIVAGGTQAGKTTLLNALLGSVPYHERVISCEEVFEIFLNHPDWVPMQTREASLEGTGEIPLRRLIKEALRMRPTRLIVGEVRQAEALDLLIAMNSGLPSMATLHANSAREAVTKLCTLPLLSGPNIGADFVLPTVAGCVDVVVHTGTDSRGMRRIREIIGISGRVEGGVIEVSEIFRRVDEQLLRSNGFPPHLERFSQAGYDIRALLDDGQDAPWES